MNEKMTMLPSIENAKYEWFVYTDFANKYNITDDISSLSDEAIQDYLEYLEEDFKCDILEMNYVIADIISDLVVMEILRTTHRKYIDNYIENALCVKYSVQYNVHTLEFGVKFDSEDERLDYLKKAIHLFDKDKIESIALDFVNFKFHTFCYFRYMFDIQYIKDKIHDKCADEIILDILDNPYSKIYHNLILNMIKKEIV